MTARTITEIEVALCKTKEFNYTRNIVAFNVKGIGRLLFIRHECDMLVLNSSGYLTEIEIKRSWSDFLADFKKKHQHGCDLIRYFYYCLPESMLEKAYDVLDKEGAKYTGIITYSEDLKIKFHGARKEGKYYFVQQHPNRKLFIEEKLQLARYGAMRVVGLKEKLNKLL